MQGKPKEKIMEIYFKYKCPYCGHENKAMQEIDSPSVPLYNIPRVVTCDSEEGGCDQDAVIYIKVIVTAETRKLVTA